jgi:hypothetical protein
LRSIEKKDAEAAAYVRRTVKPGNKFVYVPEAGEAPWHVE